MNPLADARRRIGMSRLSYHIHRTAEFTRPLPLHVLGGRATANAVRRRFFVVAGVATSTRVACALSKSRLHDLGLRLDTGEASV